MSEAYLLTIVGRNGASVHSSIESLDLYLSEVEHAANAVDDYAISCAFVQLEAQKEVSLELVGMSVKIERIERAA